MPAVHVNVNRKPQSTRFSTDILITHAPDNFRLIFFDSWTPPVPDQTGTLVQQKDIVAEVILTPPHAKDLAAQLANNVKKYEAQFGEIKVPPKGPRPVTTSIHTSEHTSERKDEEAYG